MVLFSLRVGRRTQSHHSLSKGADVIQMVFSPNLSYISPDGKEWVCRTCDRTLKRGNMPLQAKANGLQLCPVPPELSSLNALGLRLICLRVAFMKMVALPSGKQRSIHGPAVNVPSKVDTICEVLPRLTSQTEMVPLKLKRKVAYRGHYMYDFVTPQKPLDALRFLTFVQTIRQRSYCLCTKVTDKTELFNSMHMVSNCIKLWAKMITLPQKSC